MTTAIDPRAQQVLDFWFLPAADAGHLKPREAWFRKDDAFDAAIAAQFGALIDDALRGNLSAWAVTPLAALAQIIVLDQFTRNTRRDTSAMFDGDALALAAARAMVFNRFDLELAGVQRQFVCLPFEHSERLADQREALRLFEQLGRDHPELAGLLEWAQKHHDIVARFGRFPHRNAALGRVSSDEEAAFLKQPGSSF